MNSYFAYIRVSTQKQGQSGSSLHEQKDAILAFAKRHDFHIAQWFEDRETAAKKGRTQFVRMMTALEKGQAGGVILHKIDRGARNLWDWARLQDLIDAGVSVHFAHDNLDLHSRGGRLAADIQAVVAADFIRNLRDEVRKGMRGRLKQGLYPWRAPLGYVDGGPGKPKEIDPINGPLVRQAFELYATKRYSYDRLSLELYRLGLRRRNGKPISLNGLTTLLRNRFYIGLIHLKASNEVFRGAHEPLITVRLFERVQGVIDGRDNLKTQKHDLIFRRLLQCGECGLTLIGEVQKGHVYYRCHTQKCATTAIREEKVKAALASVFRYLPFHEADYDEMVPYISAVASEAEKHDQQVVAGLKLRIAAMQEREHRLADAYLDGVFDAASYNRRKEAILTDIAAARDEVDRMNRPTALVMAARAREFLELVRTFRLGPESGSVEEYRTAIEILTSNRRLTGKTLEISTRFPIREPTDTENLPFGVPDRDDSQKFDGPDLENERRARRGEDVRIIIDYLRTWEGSGRSPEPKNRKAVSHWFKPNGSSLDGQP